MYFDLARAYYTYVKRHTDKEHCIISVICDDVEIKHTLFDGLLFSGAYIYDGKEDSCDGCIMVQNDQIHFEGCTREDLKMDNFVSGSNGTIIKK